MCRVHLEGVCGGACGGVSAEVLVEGVCGGECGGCMWKVHVGACGGACGRCI